MAKCKSCGKPLLPDVVTIKGKHFNCYHKDWQALNRKKAIENNSRGYSKPHGKKRKADNKSIDNPERLNEVHQEMMKTYRDCYRPTEILGWSPEKITRNFNKIIPMSTTNNINQ